MTNQLPRQLELNLNALSRGFRQALRFALKTDPQGTEETSAAWRTVAARQALLLNMLNAIGQFMAPMAPPAPEVQEDEGIVPEAPSLKIVEAFNEVAIAPPPARNPTDEELLATLPPEIRRIHQKILAVKRWPTNNHREKTRQTLELNRLQGILQRRFKEWEATQ